MGLRLYKGRFLNGLEFCHTIIFNEIKTNSFTCGFLNKHISKYCQESISTTQTRLDRLVVIGVIKELEKTRPKQYFKLHKTEDFIYNQVENIELKYQCRNGYGGENGWKDLHGYSCAYYQKEENVYAYPLCKKCKGPVAINKKVETKKAKEKANNCDLDFARLSLLSVLTNISNNPLKRYLNKPPELVNPMERTKYKCKRCGGPRSEFSASLCRKCYEKPVNHRKELLSILQHIYDRDVKYKVLNLTVLVNGFENELVENLLESNREELIKMMDELVLSGVMEGSEMDEMVCKRDCGNILDERNKTGICRECLDKERKGTWKDDYKKEILQEFEAWKKGFEKEEKERYDKDQKVQIEAVEEEAKEKYNNIVTAELEKLKKKLSESEILRKEEADKFKNELAKPKKPSKNLEQEELSGTVSLERFRILTEGMSKASIEEFEWVERSAWVSYFRQLFYGIDCYLTGWKFRYTENLDELYELSLGEIRFQYKKLVKELKEVIDKADS